MPRRPQACLHLTSGTERPMPPHEAGCLSELSADYGGSFLPLVC